MTKHGYILGVYDPHFKIFRYASGSFLVNWAPNKFLPLNTTRLAVKIFPPKNLVYIFKKVMFFLSSPLSSLTFFGTRFHFS